MREAVPPGDQGEQVERALDRSLALTEWIRQHYPDKCEATRRSNVSLALFSICLEHREAMMLLMSYGARTSGYALVRSSFEAYLRGMWALYLATDQEFENLSRRQIPKLDTIVKRLSNRFRNGVFSRIKDSGWELMCDYSHGGSRQLARWFGGKDIGPAHPDEEVVELLRFLDSYAVLATLGAFEAAGKDATPVLVKAREIAAAHALRRKRNGAGEERSDR